MRGLGNEAVAIHPQAFFFGTLEKTIPVAGGELTKYGMAGFSHGRLLLRPVCSFAQPADEKIVYPSAVLARRGQCLGQRASHGALRGFLTGTATAGVPVTAFAAGPVAIGGHRLALIFLAGLIIHT